MTICVWPDYTWCYEEDLSEFFSEFFSDDFMRIDVPDHVEDIDAWLDETKPQG